VSTLTAEMRFVHVLPVERTAAPRRDERRQRDEVPWIRIVAGHGAKIASHQRLPYADGCCGKKFDAAEISYLQESGELYADVGINDLSAVDPERLVVDAARGGDRLEQDEMPTWPEPGAHLSNRFERGYQVDEQKATHDYIDEAWQSEIIDVLDHFDHRSVGPVAPIVDKHVGILIDGVDGHLGTK
jgi:hypothetical protein